MVKKVSRKKKSRKRVPSASNTAAPHQEGTATASKPRKSKAAGKKAGSARAKSKKSSQVRGSVAKKKTAGGNALPAQAGPAETGIPRFDLAEHIMAEQRRITAKSRMGPQKKNQTGGEGPVRGSVGSGTAREIATSSEQEKVVADIVARDIEKFCRNHTSRS